MARQENTTKKKKILGKPTVFWYNSGLNGMGWKQKFPFTTKEEPRRLPKAFPNKISNLTLGRLNS